MKGNNELKNNYYSNKDKNNYMATYSNQFTNSASIKNKNNFKSLINMKDNIIIPSKEIEKLKKSANLVNVKLIPKKLKYNNNINFNNNNYNKTNGLIHSYTYKKLNKYGTEDNNNMPVQNLSGYKKILDKMVEQYATNNNSKDNINNLLKKSILNQKNCIVKKPKIFSPSLKKNINNNKIEPTKKLYNTGDNRSVLKKNEIYRDKIIRIQSFWRGYFLRKIVVRGLKKYYGLVFIYKLLKKYISKRNKKVFKLLTELKMNNNKKNNIKKDFLYTKKLFYSNNANSKNNTDKNSFSFSKTGNEFDNTEDNNSTQKTKTFYSNEKNQHVITSYSQNFSEKNQPVIKNRLTNSLKLINLSECINNHYNNSNSLNNNNNYYSLKKSYESNTLPSSIIKGDGKNSKIGTVTSNFFNKYKEKSNQPLNVNTEFFFRKPLYKICNPKYVYTHKTKKDYKNNASEKRNNCNNNNSLKNETNYNFNNTLYNVYKFVILKINNIIKKTCYQLYFQYFLYQLKIKKKIGELKMSYSLLYKIIKKVDNKKLKKYLNIYRERVLTLKAKDFIKNENKNNICYKPIDIKNIKKYNKYLKKKISKNTLNNPQIIKNYKSELQNSERNEKKLKINNIKKNSNKKDILMKLLKIKKKFINKFILKYFRKWENNSLPRSAKNNPIVSKLNRLDINKMSVNGSNNNTINTDTKKITVNKKQLRIKRVNNFNNSQNNEHKYSSLSKEKKMRIIKRVSEPKDYLLLYHSYNKNLRDNSKSKNFDILLDENKNTILDKIFSIINKLESKKLLSRFFIYWKKEK